MFTMKRHVLRFLCLTLLLPSNVNGGQTAESLEASKNQKNVTLFTIDIPGLIGDNQGYHYNQLFEHISKSIDYRINVVSIPGRRLERVYALTGKGCAFPDYRAPVKTNPIKTDYFNSVKVYVVTLKDQPLLTVEELAGLKVGTVAGYTYDFLDISRVGHNFILANERQSFDMLSRRRMDAIISYFPDLPLVITPAEMATLHYHEDKNYYSGGERLACHDTDENRDFIKQFNKALSQAIEDNSLENILSPYFYGLPKNKAAVDQQ